MKIECHFESFSKTCNGDNNEKDNGGQLRWFPYIQPAENADYIAVLFVAGSQNCIDDVNLLGQEEYCCRRERATSPFSTTRTSDETEQEDSTTRTLTMKCVLKYFDDK
ncbi:hypothetical protein L3Y34_013152 [Caenorhabditis briggsae]|uniref:Uncharacterized protein n=1 Tax=Caenorhabditis briggsae TaxID=6238 RepID=A0AAE8ZU77_CAEBR|nr:hypothetical protein L3Y34_013152 [Caenorhabditis briggsae]